MIMNSLKLKFNFVLVFLLLLLTAALSVSALFLNRKLEDQAAQLVKMTAVLDKAEREALVEVRSGLDAMEKRAVTISLN